MAAAIVSLADAVVTDLNAATLSQSFTAARITTPAKKLSELTSLVVNVRASGERITIVSRSGVRTVEYDIDVAVRKKLTNTSNNTEHDGLVQLVEEIAGYFAGRTVTGRSEKLLGASTDENGSTLWVVDEVEGHRCFISVITLTFQGSRP